MEAAALDADLALLEKHAVPTRDLIAFYRKRLTSAEAEREDLLQRVVDVEVRPSLGRCARARVGVARRAPRARVDSRAARAASHSRARVLTLRSPSSLRLKTRT